MKIENAIIIAALRSIVWNVTVDVEGWPQWAPTFLSGNALVLQEARATPQAIQRESRPSV